MRIELVSHASLLVTTRGKTLLTDPWYFGDIYNGSWELCPPPATLPEVKQVDGVFISHGHPDHFEPRTLEWLRERASGDIPIFIARFIFDGMARELRRLGFRRVIEMQPGNTLEPWPGIRLYSQQFRLDDSLLVVQGDETLINLNDTPVRGAVLADLARRFPRPEYCTAQFAIAQGYPYCYEGISEADFTAADLIDRFDGYARVLTPRQMIPFASFVRFCAVDNQHMNPHRTTLADLRRMSQQQLTFLYPGDAIDQGRVINDSRNQQRYEAAQPATSTVPKPQSVPAARLAELLDEFVARMRRIPGPLRRLFPEVFLVVPDIDAAFCLSATQWTATTLELADRAPIRYTIASDMLADALEHPWGWEDLSIGARFRARVSPDASKREVMFWMIPILSGAGYLDWRTGWFLRWRTITIIWGRRLEFWDYALALLRGRFMSNVVRKKTADLAGN